MKKTLHIAGIAVGVILVAAGWLLTDKIGAAGWILSGAGLAAILYFLVRLSIAGKKSPVVGSDGEVPEREKPEYRRKRALLTGAERDFLFVLSSVVDEKRYRIDLQVPLVAVIDKITQNGYRNELFRVVDFCIIDAVTFAPLLLIELNDASHTRADRVERDRKVCEICQSAGMPLVAFDLAEARDISLVRRRVAKNLLRR